MDTKLDCELPVDVEGPADMIIVEKGGISW